LRRQFALCFCQAFAADHSSSGMIRRCGTTVVIHSDAGFNRDTRPRYLFSGLNTGHVTRVSATAISVTGTERP